MASAMPFLRLIGLSARICEVFPQGDRICLSIVPFDRLTCREREHIPPLHVIQDSGRQLVQVKILLHFAYKPFNVFCLFFLLCNFFIQLQQIFPQFRCSYS